MKVYTEGQMLLDKIGIRRLTYRLATTCRRIKLGLTDEIIHGAKDAIRKQTKAV
jgi:hypothetical protein